MSSLIARARVGGVAWLTALLVCFAASAASAETLMMPNRDMLMGASEVVWGITTLPNGAATTYSINFGDGSPVASGALNGAAGSGNERSYIAVNHTYGASGTFTATLTVVNGANTETATVTLNVYNAVLLSDFDLRNLNVNRAIQNALRYLWFSQSNRTTFDTTNETDWGNFINPFTALAVTAFENHGYRLPNSNAAPVGIYPKYAVRRGLNYVLARLTTLAIGVTPAGDDPCVAVPAPVCSALSAQTTGDPGYENAIALLPLAASGALLRTVTEVATANVAGKPFGEILQRMVNATIWGQNDNACCNGRGGWTYGLNGLSSDNSTNGWDLLGLLDAAGAGATVPVWVKNEWSAPAQALANGLNNDGSFDYNADSNRASAGAVNVAKAGVGVQGMFYAGRPNNDPDLVLAKAYIGNRWNEQNPVSLGTTQSFICQNSRFNKGCAYAMFNVFKGFKLYGVTTLPGVNRAAGPGSILADDWYADYVDWLVANQTAPTSLTGGFWNALSFSSQTSNDPAEAALALLILSPVALVLPDEGLFSTVGLTHIDPATGQPTINPVDNIVSNPAGTHTVTAFAQAANGNPVPGATVNFDVVTGPNSAASGTGTTGQDGKVSFTYTDNGGVGTDTIRAFIGAIGSNTLVKNWVVAGGVKCDADNDSDVDMADLVIIRNANGQMAGAGDARDGNSDGRINVADVRYCQLRFTPGPQ